jgi:hypothetical protein
LVLFPHLLGRIGANFHHSLSTDKLPFLRINSSFICKTIS